MAMHGKVATRYARAIFELMGDGAGRARILEELERFAKVMRENPELHLALSSPAFGETERRAIVDDVAKKLKASDDAARTLRVLAESRRLDVIEEILARLSRMMLESANVVPLRVSAADRLGEEEREKIEQKFQKILGRKVEASYEVDPSLLGGLRVTAAGRTYDGSLSGWLHAFEEQLVGGNA